MTSAIVVTYNSAGHVATVVQSCLRQELPVVVVDNGSTDGTLEEIAPSKLVTIIRNSANLGFAAGVNQAVLASKSPLLLLLNPDTELLDSIQPLANFAATRRRASAGLLVDSSGNPQIGFTVRRLPTPLGLAMQLAGLHQLWPGNPVNRRYRCADLDLTRSRLVEQPAGACLLFRRDDWSELGGFDERFYPVWFEDVDFCKRFQESGGHIQLDPSVRVRHLGGHSVHRIRLGLRQRYWHENLLRYAVKHFSPARARLVAGAALLGVIPRSCALLWGESPAAAISFVGSVGRVSLQLLLTGHN